MTHEIIHHYALRGTIYPEHRAAGLASEHDAVMFQPDDAAQEPVKLVVEDEPALSGTHTYITRLAPAFARATGSQNGVKVELAMARRSPWILLVQRADLKIAP